LQEDLPPRWRERIAQYLTRPEAQYPKISSADFTANLRIEFGDGSNAFFNYAFYIADPAIGEVAVFTEHCGYHVFPLYDLRLVIIDNEGNELRTDEFTIE
jgi:hypothetical protein